MEAILLNEDFEQLAIVDVFNSLIWTDRYFAFGDFELVTSPNASIVSVIDLTKYVILKESEHGMCVEYFNIHTDPVQGDTLILKGRSLETILERRILWGAKVLTGNFQTAIQDLIVECFMNPVYTYRYVPNFEFVLSTDPAITSIVLEDTQLSKGENLYDIIEKLCKSLEVGFKIILTEDAILRFNLYAGVNRSHSQSTNPYVVFSPDNDNLITGDYIETDQFLKNTVLVSGEKGVGNQAPSVSIHLGLSGLARREMFVDATNVSRITPDGELTDAEYLEQLQGVGLYELAKNQIIKSFEGQVDSTMYSYGEDFSMGDIVQTADEYGHEGQSRIVELIYSQDSSGIKIFPTFSSILE